MYDVQYHKHIRQGYTSFNTTLSLTNNLNQFEFFDNLCASLIHLPEPSLVYQTYARIIINIKFSGI